jgi:hypothetical protein
MRAAGVPQRRIAGMLGIARSTVQRMIHGEGRHAAIAAEHLEPDPDPDYAAKPRRCPGCGATIDPAAADRCIACGLPPFPVAEAAGSLDEDELAEALSLDLLPPEAARYWPVRAGKEAAAARAGELDDLSGPTDEELAEIDGEIGPRPGVD